MATREEIKEGIKPYIRGWRQATAIYIALWSLFTGNWASFKREVHIMTGFARPYGICFAPSFWESCKENLGWTDEEVEVFKENTKQKFGEGLANGD